MSDAAPTPDLARAAVETIRRRLRRLSPPPVAGLVRAVAFWVAALVPLTYLPLLATGVAADSPQVLAALVALNGVALVVGHDHRPTG